MWNNFYDGCAKYGIGATMGSSIFSENNYFRATKEPILISRQGNDANGAGKFSGEAGGMIKEYGSIFAEKGTAESYSPITHISGMRNTRRAASSPTATTFSCFVSVAIIDGSLITVPRVPPMRRVCMEPISILTSLPRVGLK